MFNLLFKLPVHTGLRFAQAIVHIYVTTSCDIGYGVVVYTEIAVNTPLEFHRGLPKEAIFLNSGYV